MNKRLLLPLAMLFSLLAGTTVSAQTFDQKRQHKKVAPPSQQQLEVKSQRSFDHIAPPAPSRLMRPIPGSPARALAPTSPSGVSVKARDQRGMPIFIEAQPDPLVKHDQLTRTGWEAAAFRCLDDVTPALPIEHPAQEFEVTKVETDELGFRHIRMAQAYQGVPVYAADLIVHFTPTGERLVNGRYHPTPTGLDVVPAISATDAITTVTKDMSVKTHYRPLRTIEKKILKYPDHQAELMIYPHPTTDELRLVYHLSFRPNFVERWEYFVDAQTGDILHSFDHTCTVGPKSGSGTDLNGQSRNFGVFEAPDGTFYLMDASKSMYTGPTNALPDQGDGVILTGDMQNTGTGNPSFYYVTSPNNMWNPTAVSAHYNAGEVYDYFQNTFNRNSINGSGGDITSFINVADDNGQGLDNAFWNGQAIFYGNGKNAFDPLAGALDVASHEVSHGVIQETANLIYEKEPGALNESFADVFGVMVDRPDWKLGEDVVRPGAFPSGALRDMSNPYNGGSSLSDPGYQPKKYSERYTGNQDNGGVHINSGIVNHAFYLIATNPSVGEAKAEAIYYRALTQYLTRSSQFLDCRIAVVRAATDRHGANSPEVAAVKSAFDQVEIFDPTGGMGTDPFGDLPVNPGQDYIISTDVNIGDPNTLYRSSTTGTNFIALSRTEHKRKISITDDGSFGYLVGTDGHIRELRLDPNNLNERIISNQAVWDNCAISKDGTKLAAITENIDTSIYVFDLVAGTGGRYTLYNPTFSQGVNGAGVLYADAMEWDHSGEYIMYDAFNQLKNNTGDDIEYWDVGFIRAWNNTSNTYGSGEVTKLFTQLDEGMSIGNGVFSKNSPYVTAFDLLVTQNGSTDYFVVTANIETGDVVQVVKQGVLGYPNFSKRDNKLLFSDEDFFGNEKLWTVDLQADKLTPKVGTLNDIIPDATWGVWYATGTRDLMVDVEESIAQPIISLQAFPTPFTHELTLHYQLPQVMQVSMALYDLTGRQVRTFVSDEMQAQGPQKTRYSLNELPAGNYVLKAQLGDEVVTQKVVKW